MSIRVVCQCGKAFKAPPQLAGKTLPCPACKSPLAIPIAATPAEPVQAVLAGPGPTALPVGDPFGGAGSPFGPLSPADPFALGPHPLPSAAQGSAPAAPRAQGTFADPFSAQLASAGLPAAAPTPAKQPPNTQLMLWLALGGGGLALVVVIGLIVAIGFNRRKPSLASSPLVTPSATNSSKSMPPSVAPPAIGSPNAASAMPAAAGAGTMPSDESAQQFAQQLEQAVNGGDAEALTRAVDWDRMLRLAVDGIDAPPQFRDAFLLGARQASANSLSSAIAPAVQKGARLHFLRVRTQQGQQRALFRFLLGDGALNYLEFVLTKQPDGQVRAIDLFVFAAGELLSESGRRMYLLALRNQPGSPSASGGSTQQEFIQNLDKFKQIAVALQNGDHSQVLQLYDSLPTNLRKEKTAFIPALRASASVDFQRHIKLAEEYRASFPNDASLELMTVDSLILKNQHDEALQALDRLDKSIGGDPYLNVLRALVVLGRDPAAAQKHAQAAIDAEPLLQPGYLVMVKSVVKQRDFDATVRWLTTMRDRFQTMPADLKTASDYTEFIQSQQYRDWLNTR